MGYSMKIDRKLAVLLVVAALVAAWALPLAADWPITEKVELDAIYKIKEEGLQRSKVMEIAEDDEGVGSRQRACRELAVRSRLAESALRRARADAARRMNALTMRNTGGTDHLSYDAVGLPGFQFIQDDVEYNSRTHHANMDVYERIQAQDMMRNAVIVASFVYNTANRDEKLPRKPLPKPTPPAGRGTSQF
jgi:Zn-dependent M28 family amino/carboxypeptidase